MLVSAEVGFANLQICRLLGSDFSVPLEIDLVTQLPFVLN